MYYMLILEAMVILIEFVSVVILDSFFFSLLSFLLFALILFGFETGYRRNKDKYDEKTVHFRKRFYRISAWVGAYFPVRLVMKMITVLILGEQLSRVLFEVFVLIIYIASSALISLETEKMK